LRSAEPFEAVQREAADILAGRIIVGHSIANDLQVCLRFVRPAEGVDAQPGRNCT
jgi:DNA polymerase III epsilon subunit-like protein